MNFKKIFLSGVATVLIALPTIGEIVDTYTFTMNLNIPRIYNNT